MARFRHGLKCGELLIKAKEACKHGEWIALLEGTKVDSKDGQESTFALDKSQTARYMKLAKNKKTGAFLIERSLADIVAALRRGEKIRMPLAERARQAAMDAVDLKDKPGKPLGSLGGNQYSANCAKTENGTISTPRGSNATSYRAAKLKRDHPDVAERLAAGEFNSVAEAERAARTQPFDDVISHGSSGTDTKKRLRSRRGVVCPHAPDTGPEPCSRSMGGRTAYCL